jgi:nucleoside phosphorylase
VHALAEEHNPFRRYVDLVHHTAPLDHWRGVVTTKSGAPRTITLVVQKEMGGIEAAVLTTRAIALLHPRAVMMSGIMGGFAAQSVAYGDVVIALQSVNYSFGKLTTTTAADGTTTEEMQRRLSIQPLRGQLAARVHAWITADRDQHGRSSFLARIRPGLLGVTNVPEPFGSRIHFGSIASGPLVVASESFIANLQRTIDDKLLGVEMEIHGVMHAGHADELPTIGIKAVVDHADARKGLSSAEADAAHAFAPHASAQLCLQLIRDDVIAMK